MKCDFTFKNGIYLVQQGRELDLHNNFNFIGVQYSVSDRTLALNWKRSDGAWVASGTPACITLTFREVAEFRFMPRDKELPFTEDDCLSSFGYWTDEDWADGVIIVDPSQTPYPKWLTAIAFMSGAVIAVQAESAYAEIKA